MSTPKDLGQLELELFKGSPWGGYSPRGLTRGHDVVILTAQAGGASEQAPDLDQYELFATVEAPTEIRSVGAPLLLRLPWEG